MPLDTLCGMDRDNDVPDSDRMKAMSNVEYKVFENRCRRAAQRQLLRLRRSRRRDPLAWDYGRYELIDADDNIVAAGELRDIYRYLIRRRPRR
jgi:hypothetical protein